MTPALADLNMRNGAFSLDRASVTAYAADLAIRRAALAEFVRLGEEVEELAHVLSTVNAPYSRQLSAGELARALTDLEAAKSVSGQVSSFLGEVPVESQRAFAWEHGVPLETLEATARQFAAWSGESYPIVSSLAE